MQKKDLRNIHTEYYDYILPEEKIAKYPLIKRDDSKLLVYKENQITDTNFTNIQEFIDESSLLVFNNTKVINSRLHFYKSSGAKIEIFCLEPENPVNYDLSLNANKKCRWKCLVGNGKKWKDEILILESIINHTEVSISASKIERFNNGFLVEFSWNNENILFSDILRETGETPIPPYLNRKSERLDKTRYQTIYGKNQGSVAAPTAGLHFTEDIFEKLKEKRIEFTDITLHVGAGTFLPVKTDNINDHVMHTEHFSVSLSKLIAIKNNINKLCVVGTTSARCLESIYCIGYQIARGISNDYKTFSVSQWEAYNHDTEISAEESLTSLIKMMIQNNIDKIDCSTGIMIIPGYKFKITRKLITNFHQPKSTLLMLIAAFIGDSWKDIYNHALLNNYRFLSYGDSMLLQIRSS